MSFFGANALKPVTTSKRKEVRTVPQQAPRQATNGHGLSTTATMAGRSQQPRPVAKPPSMTDRYKMTPSARKPSALPSKVARTSLKRKSETPQPTPLSSDSESEEEAQVGEQEEHRRKRLRGVDGPRDPKRRVRDIQNWPSNDQAPSQPDIVHSRDLTSGPAAKGFSPVFVDDPDAEVTLQYPSAFTPETFRFANEHGHDGYNSLDDLRRTMDVILKNYLPDSAQRAELLSDTGISWHLSPTKRNKDLAAIRGLIDSFNNLITKHLADSSIASTIDALPFLPLPLVERIMSQTYVRTVSPDTDVLKKYVMGSDNTYGELQPIFCSQIFQETGLRSDSVFLDLGSGVGNVVIQAALETGCESWGVESVHDWHNLAEKQAAEFRARSRLWGLSAGEVHLLEADFLSCPELDKLLPRADVVIVNNFKFSSTTNDNLKLLFLALKEGAKVVSLRSFVTGELKERNMNDVGNQFEVQEKLSFDNAVSWEGDPVTYYLATKDSGRIERILGKGGRR